MAAQSSWHTANRKFLQGVKFQTKLKTGWNTISKFGQMFFNTKVKAQGLELRLLFLAGENKGHVTAAFTDQRMGNGLSGSSSGFKLSDVVSM